MKDLYRKNRVKLAKNLGKGLVLAVSGQEKIRNNDVHYLFRQDSDFLYLTGVTHPEHAILIETPSGKSHLILPDLDEKHRIWIGRQMTREKALRTFGVDHAHYISDFKKLFNRLSQRKPVYTLENSHAFLRRQKIRIPQLAHTKTLRLRLNEQRLRKTPQEIKLMQTANEISHQGHLAAMKFTRPGVSELEVQAVLQKQFMFHGAPHNAYSSIVAAGANAAILHYHSQNSSCTSGDLLLIDAGAEWMGYASDVTRTFPINGRFSRAQREIYSIVLDAQKQCLNKIRAGLSFLEIHLHACRVISQGLLDLGILQGPLESILKEETYKIFFPHGVGHLLGLDVHDVGAKDPNAKVVSKKNTTLRASRVLEPQFAITVEPGIYFIEAHFESKQTRQRTRKSIDWKKAETYFDVGGIRIEDDVIVTKEGHLNLTTVPKEISEIEKIMSQK